MTRSILFSIMFIAGALGVVIFSAAQFTDAETTTSNTVRAGTIELNVPTQINCPVPSHGLEGAPSSAPADSQTQCTFSLIHDGTLPNADLYAQIEVAHIACEDVTGTNNGDDWHAGFDSLYCDAGADLTEQHFRVIAASLDTHAPGWPSHLSGGNPILFSQFISASHSGSSLGACTKVIETMPVNQTVNGSITLQLDQTLTRNIMQGDAIDVTIWFELAEQGATGVDCRLDDPVTGVSPITP